MEEPDLPLYPAPTANARLIHKQRYMKACTAMRTKLRYNTYSVIEDVINISKMWTKIEEEYKPQGSGIFNI